MLELPDVVQRYKYMGACGSIVVRASSGKPTGVHLGRIVAAIVSRDILHVVQHSLVELCMLPFPERVAHKGVSANTEGTSPKTA